MRIFTAINDFFRNVRYGIWNIIQWTPIIWRDRDWDWYYLSRIMEFKLRKMNKAFVKYGHHVGSERDARQMLICAELLKRLQDDDAEDFSKQRDDWRNYYKLHEIRMKEWQEMFGKYMGKFLRNWWD